MADSLHALIGRNLRESVLPFWTRHTWDAPHGGFLGHVDNRGQPAAVTDKYLLIQARMVWTLAAAHRHGITDRDYLELAGQGFRFIVDLMRDDEYGGFLHAVRRDGSPLDTQKWVYTHSFVIFAFSEYFLASGDDEALEWAGRTFDTLQRQAGDGGSGWREYLRRDWTPTLRRRRMRTSNLHMHLLEAFTVLYRASRQEPHRAALALVTDLMQQRTLHETGCVLDKFSLDWKPKRSVDLQVTTSYGHGAELAHLLLDAGFELGLSEAEYLPAAVRLVDHALAWGFDPARGGVARYGAPDKHVLKCWHLRPRRLQRGSWEQAEMLLGLLRVHACTGKAVYLKAFATQFGWIWRHQVDHEDGDWHPWVGWPGGRSLGSPKGTDHRCCYHQARALMGCEKLLAEAGLKDWAPAGL